MREFIHDALTGGFFHELPAEQLDGLLAESSRMDVPTGAVVYREGDSARCFFVVSGLLRSFVSSRDGRQITFRYGKSGDVMGLASLTGEPLPLTIQAMTDSSVVAVRVETLRRMLETDPAVARVCAQELTRQLNQALDGVARSAFYSIRQKLARELLNLATESDGPHLVAQVTHQELADSIASSREVVTRSLREMRADGLIETGRDRQVTLLDVDRLAREVEAGGEAYIGEAGS
jgi:CRP/FNR family transcriptional regulator